MFHFRALVFSLLTLVVGCGSQVELSQGIESQLSSSGVILGHFSEDGEWIVTVDESAKISIFDELRQEIFSVPKDKVKLPVMEVLLSNDKNMLVVAGENLVSIWSVEKKKLVTNIPFAGVSPLASISAVALSSDNRRLLVAMDDGSLNMADLFTKLNNRFMPHTRPIQHLAFDNTGEKFVTGAQDGRVALWNFASPDAIYETQFDHRVTSLTVSKDGKMLFVSDGLNAQHILDFESGELLTDLKYMARFKVFRKAKFIEGSGLLATSSSKSHLSIWKYESGEEVGTWSIKTHRDGATIVDMFVADKNTLVTLNSDGILEKWALNMLAEQ
ncbi:WD40 repeat domain-containing protein [Pseudoalteromonas sp. T1lg65]|uniref:WD40 repeat domain-containing protein n=1 Tax=Pseudoalteromonas sp. T1lg65 TaxID=2077101 RepID=UPI003F79A661